MGQRRLLPGEIRLAAWGPLVLTTLRVWIEWDSNTYEMRSIPIDDVGFARLQRDHKPLWLAGAVLLAIAGAFHISQSRSVDGVFVCVLVVALICIAKYLSTRRMTLKIASSAGNIESLVEGDIKQALAFIGCIEHQALRIRKRLPADIHDDKARQVRDRVP